MVGDAGAVVGPLLAGVVAQVLGFPVAFALTALAAAASFGAWLVAPETLPSKRR